MQGDEMFASLYRNEQGHVKPVYTYFLFCHHKLPLFHFVPTLHCFEKGGRP